MKLRLDIRETSLATHRTKTNKTQKYNTTLKTKTGSNTDPTKNRR